MITTQRPSFAIDEPNDERPPARPALDVGRREFLRKGGALAVGVGLGLGAHLSTFAGEDRPIPPAPILTKGELFCRNTVIGEGQGACGASIRELHLVKYKGTITIDFEHDTPALQKDMARNIAFIEEQAKRLLDR